MARLTRTIRHLGARIACAAGALGLAGWASPTGEAQVFSPVVREGDRSVQYRATYLPGEGDRPDQQRHRLHYQQAIDSKWRWRIIAQGSDVESGDFELNFVQGELVWQFMDSKTAPWDSAFRFDARAVEGDDGASRVGVNWTNQKDWGPWRMRALTLTSVDVGDQRRDGLLLQTRFGGYYKLENGPRLALEVLNVYGRTQSLGSFNDQSHQIGPAIYGTIGEMSYRTGVLVGVSDGARNYDIRFRLTRGF
ncbi:MAG: hypothetical protein AAGB25_08900 [Pseudomonadota bacterium]